jgi:sarcosine oxidase subunit gamma
MAELTLTDTQVVSPDVRPVSPAQHLDGLFAAATVTGSRAVALRELRFLTMISLRVELRSGPAERLTTTLGVRLPTTCGGVSVTADSSVLWLAPDEFLVVSVHDPAELTSRLVAALHGEPGSVVDVSANRTTLELSGPSARDVLEKGCPLDLHPRSYSVGAAYATTLAGVPVVLWRTGEQAYRILPRSSFADHVGRWLVDAMLEYQVPEPA